MEVENFTREELAEYILNTAKDSVINEIKGIVSKKREEIVSYTTQGELLTKEKYVSHLEAISDKIDKGAKTNTTEEVREYVLNRKSRLG